jgi:Tfp pilus assembly protein PilO
MGARHVDRIWIFAGAAVIVALTIASWFLLISPKYVEAAGIRDQAEGTRSQLVTLQRKLTDLQRDSAQLPQFRAALLKNQQALPLDSGVPDFLRQLQASGDKAGATVSNVTVAAPELVTGSTSVYEIPMTLSANGTTAQISAFLVRLQNVQPRAVLIESANLTAQTSTTDAATAIGSQINLMLKAFVAPPAGAGAPTITTK